MNEVKELHSIKRKKYLDRGFEIPKELDVELYLEAMNEIIFAHYVNNGKRLVRDVPI